MKTKVLLLPLLVLISACERKEEKAQIKIQLPAATSPKVKSVAKVSAQSNDGSWGVPVPSNISEVNCYAVFVGGPESSLRDKSCIKGEGSSFEKFYFSHMKGFVSAASELTFDIDSGPARKFYVLGVKSTSSTCQEFSNPDLIDQSVMSNPMLVGTAQADLAPGQNNITVSASVSADTNTQILHDCSFFGSSGNPTSLSLKGGISTEGSGPNSMLGIGTCNRVRIFAKSDNRSALLENDLNVNLSTSGSIGVFYSAPDCVPASFTTVATIPRGKDYVDTFFSAGGTPSTTGTVNMSAVYNGVTLEASKPVSISAQGTYSHVRFFDERLNMGTNSCADVPFYGVDNVGQTVDVPGSQVIPVFSLNDTEQTGNIDTSMVGFSFKDSCSGSAISNFPLGSASNVISLSMGTIQYKDFQIGTLGFEKLSVNVTPKATSLDLTLSNNAPYASDCTQAMLKAIGPTGVLADLSGYDSSPWLNIDKIVKAQFYSNNGSAQKYINSDCTSPDSNGLSILTSSGTSMVSRYFQFSNSGVVSLRGYAGSFVSNNNEVSKDVGVKWDPGVLASAPGQYMSFFRAPLTLSAGNNFQKTNWIATMSKGGLANTIVDGLGIGNHVSSLGVATTLTGGTLGGASSFSYGILVKFDMLPSTQPIISLRDSGNSIDLAALMTGASSNDVFLMGRDGVPSAVPSAPVTIADDTWYSFVVTRDSGGECRWYINGILSKFVNCSGGAPGEFLKIDSAGKTTKFPEFFFVNRILTANDVKQYHNYLSERYSGTGLVPVP